MGLTKTQERAARYLGLDICETKTEVAKKCGISKRTIFNWLQDEQFLEKIEEYRHSAEIQLTPEYILANTSEDDKVQLVKMLQNDEEVGKHLLPEIKTLIGRVRKADAKFDDLMLRDIKEELEKVVGLIKHKLGSKAYTEDGELLSQETEWYETLEKLEKNFQIIELLDSAGYEEDRGVGDNYVMWEKTKKHRAYKSAIDTIEEKKKKLKATGRVIEADQ